MEIICQNSRKDHLSCLQLGNWTGPRIVSKDEGGVCCLLEMIVVFTFFHSCPVLNDTDSCIYIYVLTKGTGVFLFPHFPPSPLRWHMSQRLPVHWVLNYSWTVFSQTREQLCNRALMSFSLPPNCSPFSLSARHITFVCLCVCVRDLTVFKCVRVWSLSHEGKNPCVTTYHYKWSIVVLQRCSRCKGICSRTQ